MYQLEQRRTNDHIYSGQIAIKPDITERFLDTAHSQLETLANFGSKAVDVLYTPVTTLISQAYHNLNDIFMYARKPKTRQRVTGHPKKLPDLGRAPSEGEMTDDRVQDVLDMLQSTKQKKKKKKRNKKKR